MDSMIPMEGDEARTKAKNILKAELKRHGVSYKNLAHRLTARGHKESPRNLANKISRGGFTAAFLVQIMEAIGVKEIRLD